MRRRDVLSLLGMRGKQWRGRRAAKKLDDLPSPQYCVPRSGHRMVSTETGALIEAENYCRSAQPMSESGQKHELPRRSIAVRFTPNKQTPTERVQCDASCQLLTHAPQQRAAYSMTSSARPSSGKGTVIPSARAVLRFTINSTLVACCTGRSAGFSPLRILPV
jgi:hypothetical protein